MCEVVDLGGGNFAIVCGAHKSEAKAKPKTIAWPATCLELEAAGYRLMHVRACKLCYAPIEFWETPAHKFLPCDRGRDGKRTPHWSTCPRANEFRKKAEQADLFK